MNKIGKSLGLALLGILLMLGAAAADTSKLVDLTAHLDTQYEIGTAPGPVIGWDLELGENIHDTTTAGLISSNGPWMVQVKEYKWTSADGDGKMADTYDNAFATHTLTDQLQVKNRAGTPDWFAVTGTDQTIASGDAGIALPYSVDYKQNIEATDNAPDTYYITLEYTISST